MSNEAHNILIADQNRYHAMLIEKELQNRLSQVSTKVCSNSKSAFNDLKSGKYEVAIVDYSMLLDESKILVSEIRSEIPELPILVTAPIAEIHPDVRHNNDGMVGIVLKDATFHILIQQLIENLIVHGSFNGVGRKFKPRLSTRRKADMINIMASTLSHEINNPLMAILGISELLLDSSKVTESTEIHEKIRIIQESAVRIEQTVANLAQMSRPILKSTVAGNYIDTSAMSDSSDKENN